jgi:hypothetical protein
MTSRRFLPALLLLFVGSGCAALIYEVVWFQLLQLVIGSSAVWLWLRFAVPRVGLQRRERLGVDPRSRMATLRDVAPLVLREPTRGRFALARRARLSLVATPLPEQPPGSDWVIDCVVSRTIAMLYFCAAAPAMSALEAADRVRRRMPRMPPKIVGMVVV